MGGTTYAASTSLIGKNTVASPQVVNGSLQTKDLSAKARAALKGNRGLRGLTGARGATGLQGIQGSKGDQGPAGPFPGVLPSGKTIRGTYAIYNTATAASQYTYDSISFGFVLASAPTIHFIKTGTAAPAECPGTLTAPAAQPGNLCVYESSTISNVGVDRNAWVGPLGGSASGVLGASVYTSSAAAGAYYDFGTWAVTSP